MSAEYLHGHIIAEALPYTTEHRLLAEIKAIEVERLHEAKVSNDIQRQQTEILRKIALQLKVLDIQIGLLRERLPKGEHGDA